MSTRRHIVHLASLTIIFASMLGCSKKEDSSTVEDETAPESSIQATEKESPEQSISQLKEDSSTVEDDTAPESSIQATEPESPEQSISPLIEQFLKKSASYKKVAAGHSIREYFDFWEDLLHDPRISMNIYFEVELEEKFQRDHIWENKTNQEILDDLCNEYNLTWTTPEPNTIRISKRTE